MHTFINTKVTVFRCVLVYTQLTCRCKTSDDCVHAFLQNMEADARLLLPPSVHVRLQIPRTCEHPVAPLAPVLTRFSQSPRCFHSRFARQNACRIGSRCSDRYLWSYHPYSAVPSPSPRSGNRSTPLSSFPNHFTRQNRRSCAPLTPNRASTSW